MKNILKKEIIWSEDKQAFWDKTLGEVTEVGIEPAVRETVAALLVNGFSPFSSCEGHIHEPANGQPFNTFPIIYICRQHPKQRFEGEESIKKLISQKFNISKDSVPWNEESRPAYRNYIRTHGIHETIEYLAFRMDCEDLERKNLEIMEAFYKIRTIQNPNGCMNTFFRSEIKDGFILQVGGGTFQEDLDLKQLKQELSMAQEEMAIFGQFLKNWFFKHDQRSFWLELVDRKDRQNKELVANKSN